MVSVPAGLLHASQCRRLRQVVNDVPWLSGGTGYGKLAVAWDPWSNQGWSRIGLLPVRNGAGKVHL